MLHSNANNWIFTTFLNQKVKTQLILCRLKQFLKSQPKKKLNGEECRMDCEVILSLLVYAQVAHGFLEGLVSISACSVA